MTGHRSIGERIQARRLQRGWSMRYAAARAGIAHSTWGRIERGELAADNRFVLADIAAALECAPADLAGAPSDSAAGGDAIVAAAHRAVHAVRGALIHIDLAEPADRPAPPVAELARTVALADSLRQSCDYAAAVRLAPDLLRDLHAAAAGPDRGDALRLLCDAAFITSSVLRNLGHPAEAWLAAERCRDAAEATENPVLLGYAAYARANAAITCGSYRRGLALATRAIDDLRPHAGPRGGAEVLGSLQLICAYAARAGKRIDDSRAWADEAAGLARRTGETTTMSLYFGPANVGIWRIGIEVDGDDPGRAAEVAGRTDPAAVPAGFRQVFYHADAARALARLRGRDREAIDHLLTAERLAPQHMHTSPTAQETTRWLLERSRRQAGGGALRALSGRMGLG